MTDRSGREFDAWRRHDHGTGTIENRGVIDLIGAAALANGSLSNFGLVDVSGNGNALHNEVVSNFGLIHVTGELTFDLGTAITGGVRFKLRYCQDRGRAGRNAPRCRRRESVRRASARHRDDAGGRNGYHHQWRDADDWILSTFEVAALSAATLGARRRCQFRIHPGGSTDRRSISSVQLFPEAWSPTTAFFAWQATARSIRRRSSAA